MDPYRIGVIVGALFAGAVIGAIPFFLGRKKGKNGLAIGGFAACVISGLILGALLAIPVCIIFVVLILVLKDNNANAAPRAAVSTVDIPVDPYTGNQTNNDAADTLRALKDLHESGVLTDEEFAEQKMIIVQKSGSGDK